MAEVEKSSEKKNNKTEEVPSENEMKRRTNYIPSWWFEHLLLPIIVVIAGITLNNYWQSKKQPNLTAYAEEHQATKISESNFQIRCPFTIINSGGSITKKRKVTLSLRPSANIGLIDISKEYKSFYNLEEGGDDKSSFVVISVDLPKNKKIEGAIVFYSNVEIPAKSMCPLKIIY